jgi:ADP-dependent glucokinase
MMCPNVERLTGGNAAIMANNFIRQNVCLKVFLGAKVGKMLDTMTSTENRLPNEKNEDEVHVIVEYNKGKSWNNENAPRTNRFILQSDDTNGKLLNLEPFHEVVKSNIPDLLVIAGLHLLESQPKNYRLERLSKVKSFITNELPKSTIVHFETASVSTKEFDKELFQEITQYADSIGLNEQELKHLYQTLGGKSIKLDTKNPSPRHVIEMIKFIFSKVQQLHAKEDPLQRKLTRLHFHTLKFHLVVVEKGSVWNTTSKALRRAVAAGSISGVRRACGVDWLSVDQMEAEVFDSIPGIDSIPETPIDNKQPITILKEGDLVFSFTPHLACRTIARSVGLGDVISSASLAHHLNL